MGQRKIDVIHTSSQEQITRNTDIRTWGELKSYYPEINRMASGMKAVVKETKVTLESDDAVLPDGPCVIYLTMGKVKAGKVQLPERVTKRIQELVDDTRKRLIASLG